MRTLLPILAVLGLAASALGVVETQTLTVSNGGLTDFYATLDIPQHDEVAEGELLSVSMEITAELDGQFRYENLGASTGGFQIHFVEWTFTGDFQAATLLGESQNFSHPLTLVGAYDGVTDFAGTSGATAPYGGTATATASWLPGDAGFDAFAGTGTLPFDVATTVLTSHTVYGGQATSGFSTDTTWTVVLTYEYDPLTVANEPLTWSEVKSLYR